MSDCPTPFELESLQVGDLPAVRAEALGVHLEQCANCRALVAQWKEEGAPFAANIEAQAVELRRRMAQARDQEANRGLRRWNWPVFRMLVVGAVAASAVGLFLIVRPSDTPMEQPGRVKYKGRASLQIVANRGGKQFFVEQGVATNPGDRLRFVLTSASPGYLSIFSVDNKNKVWPLYPQKEVTADPAPRRVAAAGRHELPESVLLDAALGKESFVAIFSEATFDRARLQRRIDEILRDQGRAGLTAAGLGLSAPAQVFVITANKVAAQGTR